MYLKTTIKYSHKGGQNMSKKLKLGEKMDLIEIYENNQWEEFLEKYREYVKETKELRELISYFEETYYIDLYIWRLPFYQEYLKNKYEEITGEIFTRRNKEYNSWAWQYERDIFKKATKEMPIYKIVLGEDFEINENVYDDEKIARLEELSKKWLRANRRFMNVIKLDLSNPTLSISDERSEFARKYFGKSIISVNFETSLEEAIDYGYQEIIDFLSIKDNSKKALDFSEYLAKKLRKLREKENLSIEELMTRLELKGKFAKYTPKKYAEAIEKYGYDIDLDLLIKYANYFNFKLDDILHHNSVMEGMMEKERRKKTQKVIDCLSKKFKKYARILTYEVEHNKYMFEVQDYDFVVTIKGEAILENENDVTIIITSNARGK